MISDESSIENKILLFSHLIIRSLLPKKHRLAKSEFDEFIELLSAELDRKKFKGKVSSKNDYNPVYKHENVENCETTSALIINPLNAYTGLFGIILAVAVLYSIKHR